MEDLQKNCIDLQREKELKAIASERVYYLKETEGGRNHMCKIVEDLMEDRFNEEKIELAKNAIEQGEFNVEQISRLLKLPIDVVQKLADGIPV